MLEEFNDFLCIYLCKGSLRGGGFINAYIHVCLGTNSISHKTDWWILTRLGRDEVNMALYMRLGYSAKSQEVDPKLRKNSSMRGPLSRWLLFQIGMQQQKTKCILVFWIEISRLFAILTVNLMTHIV